MPTTTDAERVASIQEVIRAANGDWHEATSLWSIGEDLDWLLARASAAPAPPAVRDRIDVDVLLEQLAEITEDRTATDPDDDWHRGFHEAILRVRVAMDAARLSGEPVDPAVREPEPER